MSERSVIVIGAGLAGLSAGYHALTSGYRVDIYEHHGQPGGVAAAWRRGDYEIDGGIHFLMGHRPGQPMYDLYKEVGATESGRFLDMEALATFVDERGSPTLAATGDLDRLAADLKAISPADGPAIDDLISGARAFRSSRAFYESGMGDPPEIAGRLGPVRMMWGMRGQLRYMFGRHGRSIAEYAADLHDPWLRWVVPNLFLPEAPMWFLYGVLAMMADGQMGLIEAGSGGFVRAIESRVRDLGGGVRYDATVDEILVEEDRAVGVRLADGSTHRADAVIAAGDAHHTIYTLLGGRFTDPRIDGRFREWPLCRPLFMASWGVARTFAGLPHETYYRLETPFTVGDRSVDGFSLRVFNYSTAFAPTGKTVIQAAFETDWDYWNGLRGRGADYDAEKARLADELLTRLETHFPHVAEQVEVADIATPHTLWRYTLNYRASYMGWLPTGRAMMTTIPRTLPGLAGLYLAGQWVIPGGGVPFCLVSGRQAVQLLCRDDRRPFPGGSS